MIEREVFIMRIQSTQLNRRTLELHEIETNHGLRYLLLVFFQHVLQTHRVYKDLTAAEKAYGNDIDFIKALR